MVKFMPEYLLRRDGGDVYGSVPGSLGESKQARFGYGRREEWGDLEHKSCR